MECQRCSLCRKELGLVADSNSSSHPILTSANENIVSVCKSYLKKRIETGSNLFDREFWKDTDLNNYLPCSNCLERSKSVLRLHSIIKELKTELDSVLKTFTEEIQHFRTLDLKKNGLLVSLEKEKVKTCTSTQEEEIHEIREVKIEVECDERNDSPTFDGTSDYELDDFIHTDGEFQVENKLNAIENEYSSSNDECSNSSTLKFTHNLRVKLERIDETTHSPLMYLNPSLDISKRRKNKISYFDEDSENSDSDQDHNKKRVKRRNYQDPLGDCEVKLKVQKCGYCGQFFKTWAEIQEHRRVRHPDKRFECPQCDKLFTTRKARAEHVICLHTEERPFVCDKCGFSFKLKRRLEIHKLIHTRKESSKNVDEPEEQPDNTNEPEEQPDNTNEPEEQPDNTNEPEEQPDNTNEPIIKSQQKQKPETNADPENLAERQIPKCGYCLRTLHSWAELREHRTTNHADKMYECPQCDARFTTLGARGEHMTCVHTEERPFVCDQCGIAFKMKKRLKLHKKIHLPKENQCDQCGKRFTFSRDLRRHELTHLDKLPFVCATCGSGFVRASYLVNHERTHTGEKPFTCEKCGKGFIQKAQLTYHNKSGHCERKEFECELCGVQLASEINLKKHMAHHQGEHTLICSVCNKRMFSKQNLINHMRLHTGEKPYVCSHCDKTFAIKHSLTSHFRIHTGERPHKCPHCLKDFRVLSHLNRHMRMNCKKI